MFGKLAITTMGFCFLFFAGAWAEVPRQLSYQGRITDKNNLPVSNGPHTLTIRLYNSSSGGQVLWSDSFTVEFKNGYFNTILGSQVAFPENLNFDAPYFLGATFEGETEMQPRQALNSVPYAFRAQRADFAENAARTEDGMPAGTILAWHKNFASLAPLSNHFMECNGQQVTDPASPFYLKYLPNLNGAASTGHFLRGSDRSGDFQTDTLAKHAHGYQTGGENGSQWGVITDWIFNSHEELVKDSGGTETRPKNMSVVWIIKIK